jgi:hypothetical protein
MAYSKKIFKVSAVVTAVFVCSVILFAAATFNPQFQPPGYLAGIALSNDDLRASVENPTGGAKAYRPWFENGAWQGDLIEYDVSSTGALSTSVDLSSTPPTNTGGNWSARLQLDAKDWDTSRKIITNSGGQVAFRWSNLSDAQKSALDPTRPLTDTSSDIVNFIRGDRTNEEPVGTLRQRFSALGDIIHTTPVYVGPPNKHYAFDNYEVFRDDNASRPARVYAGANDGMLHIFDADTGEEVYSYIPSMLISKLNNLSAAHYLHTYFVDGPLYAGDVYVEGDDEWKTILVGGLGAGGQGLFALDITDPDLSSESSTAGTDAKLLWELTDTDISDLGYTYSQPVIARFNDGNWYVAVGNGYNSSNGEARLLIINVLTGDVVANIETDGSGFSGNPNGLSGVALVDAGDVNNDGSVDKVDYAYAGDIDGNLWKFDLSSTNPNDWSVAYAGTPVYDGDPSQPITVTPDLIEHPGGGFLVYFGTGRIYTSVDSFDPTTQAVYAIWDKGTTPETPNLLVQTSTQTTHASDEIIRVSSDYSIDWDTHTGWKMELPPGERLLTMPQVRAFRLQFITTNPTAEDGENWLVEPDYFDGGQPSATIFDLNRDGSLNDSDKQDDANPVAWRLGKGLVSHPVFARIELGIDTLFINNLVLPTVDWCNGYCIGGMAYGHIDVETDSPAGPDIVGDGADGLGGATDGHSHRYDKIHGVTYVDYFDLEPRRGLLSLDVEDGVQLAPQKLNRVTEVKKPDGSAPPIAGDKEFIVVLSNADLSPGGTLTIGAKEWNVVDYQDMITAQLLAGKTKDQLVDEDGDSLVFTLDDIQAGGGTLRISFDNTAIIQGGLHPTVDGCVRGNYDWYDYTPSAGHGTIAFSENKHITPVMGGSEPSSASDGFRWRNGALTMQLLDADNFTLESANYLPQDSSGNVVGGVYAKAFSNAHKHGGDYDYTMSMGPNNSGMLYETTVFWHYGELYQYLRNGRHPPCYGNSNWSAAVTIERGGLTFGEYQSLLDGLDDDSAEIVAYADALSALENYVNTGGTDESTIEQLLTDLADAIDPIKEYVKYRGYAPGHVPEDKLLGIDKQPGNGADGSSGFINGQPAEVTGDPEDTGNTPGPNFVPGQRTWTDL